MLSPQYLAGLYDAHGHGGIWLRDSRRMYRSMPVVMVGLSIEYAHIHTLSDYLKTVGIVKIQTYEQKNKLGRSCGVNMYDIHAAKFIDLIKPYVVFKKHRLEILARAVHLKLSLPRGSYGYIPVFDQMRHELHLFSTKGPKKLKPWPADYGESNKRLVKKPSI